MQQASKFRINLGGEGEEFGVLNQQPLWFAEDILDPNWRSSQFGKTWAALVQEGHAFLFCDNTSIELPDSCADEVITHSVPIDIVTFRGPGVQSSEVERILKSGGMWIQNGQVRYVKP